jgi:hypothetical protein
MQAHAVQMAHTQQKGREARQSIKGTCNNDDDDDDDGGGGGDAWFSTERARS